MNVIAATPADIYDVVAGVVVTVLAVGGTLGLFWLALGRSAWKEVRAFFGRIEQMEEKIEAIEVRQVESSSLADERYKANRAHQEAGLEQLTRINGSVGGHEGRLAVIENSNLTQLDALTELRHDAAAAAQQMLRIDRELAYIRGRVGEPLDVVVVKPPD